MKAPVIALLLIHSACFAAEQNDIAYRTKAGSGPLTSGNISALTAATPSANDMFLGALSSGALRKYRLSSIVLPWDTGVSGKPSFATGTQDAGAPTITPGNVFDRYFDTENLVHYRATCTTSAECWVVDD